MRVCPSLSLSFLCADFYWHSIILPAIFPSSSTFSRVFATVVWIDPFSILPKESKAPFCLPNFVIPVIFRVIL